LTAIYASGIFEILGLGAPVKVSLFTRHQAGSK